LKSDVKGGREVDPEGGILMAACFSS